MMSGVAYGLFRVCGMSEIFPRVPPTSITDFASKTPMVYLKHGVSCFGFGVVVLLLLLLFYKLTTVPDYLHTVQYVCLLE